MDVLHNGHHQRKPTVIHTTHNKMKEPNLVQLMYSYFNWKKKKKEDEIYTVTFTFHQ